MSYDLELYHQGSGFTASIHGPISIFGYRYEVDHPFPAVVSITRSMSNFLMFVLGAAGTDTILAMTAAESLLVLDAGHTELIRKYTPSNAHKIELETYEVIRGIARLARVQTPHAVWRTDP